MNVGVIGGGEIGTGLVRRLVTTTFVSEVTWLNRSLEKIAATVVDIQQGLAFSPSCRRVVARPADARGARSVKDCDVVVLAIGQGVPEGGTRRDVLRPNEKIVREAVTTLLTDFAGVLLVVSN